MKILAPDDLAYLATPYTLYPGTIDRAFREAARITSHLCLAGLTVFSPIVHSHPLAVVGGLDHRNPAIFDRLNRHMLRLAAVLIVAQMDGWQNSDGVRDEVAFFQQRMRPIFDLSPATLVMTRRSPAPYAHDKTRSEQGGASA